MEVSEPAEQFLKWGGGRLLHFFWSGGGGGSGGRGAKTGLHQNLNIKSMQRNKKKIQINSKKKKCNQNLVPNRYYLIQLQLIKHSV